MPKLTVVIPVPHSAALERTEATSATSPDSLVTPALTQHFQTDRHRTYQISPCAGGCPGGLQTNREVV
jgi:hypothetical protein